MAIRVAKLIYFSTLIASADSTQWLCFVFGNQIPLGEELQQLLQGYSEEYSQ